MIILASACVRYNTFFVLHQMLEVGIECGKIVQLHAVDLGDVVAGSILNGAGSGRSK